MEARETQKRSITKAITYRLLATISTFSLAYFFTGNLELASQIGVLDFLIKFALYYLNERVWNQTTWGYRK